MDKQRSQKAPMQGKKNKNSALQQKKSPLSGGKSVSVPVAQASVRSSPKPKFQGLPDGDIVISHREYIQDISGSVAFTNNTFNVNPALPGTFPWLSAVAQRFESYLFEKLSFEFETQSPTSATGTVLITLDYDASDDAPINKTQALSYRSSVRSPPWADCCHSSLSEDLHKHKSFFCRNGSLAANQDVKLYDTAICYLSTQGQAGATAVGELYVDYRVKLMTPQMNDPRLGEAVWGTFAGASNAAPFVLVSGNLPVTVTSSGTTTSVTTFTFNQPWSGIATFYAAGTGITGFASSGTGDEAEQWELLNAGGTIGTCLVYLDEDVGETYIITVSNTTLTAPTSVWFAQSSGNL